MSAIGAYTPVLADSESQVTVCILDSGCNMENITGWNYLEGSDNLSDNSGHGTGVCEILLEKALDANLVMLKCFDGESENQTDDNTIIQAIYDLSLIHIFSLLSAIKAYLQTFLLTDLSFLHSPCKTLLRLLLFLSRSSCTAFPAHNNTWPSMH